MSSCSLALNKTCCKNKPICTVNASVCCSATLDVNILSHTTNYDSSCLDRIWSSCSAVPKSSYQWRHHWHLHWQLPHGLPYLGWVTCIMRALICWVVRRHQLALLLANAAMSLDQDCTLSVQHSLPAVWLAQAAGRSSLHHQPLCTTTMMLASSTCEQQPVQSVNYEVLTDHYRSNTQSLLPHTCLCTTHAHICSCCFRTSGLAARHTQLVFTVITCALAFRDFESSWVTDSCLDGLVSV